MIEAVWPLAISQAVIRHFYDGCTNTFNMYTWYEGLPLDERNKYSEWAEIRMKGPEVVETSRDQFHAELTVDMLYQTAINQNIYYLPKRLGEIASLYVCIPVYLYADDADPDNDVLLGVLDLLPANDIRSGVKITSFNRLPGQPHQRGNIFGIYEMDFHRIN